MPNEGARKRGGGTFKLEDEMATQDHQLLSWLGRRGRAATTTTRTTDRRSTARIVEVGEHCDKTEFERGGFPDFGCESAGAGLDPAETGAYWDDKSGLPLPYRSGSLGDAGRGCVHEAPGV